MFGGDRHQMLCSRMSLTLLSTVLSVCLVAVRSGGGHWCGTGSSSQLMGNTGVSDSAAWRTERGTRVGCWGRREAGRHGCMDVY